MDTLTVRNTNRGTVGPVRRRIFESPVLNPGILVEVEHDAKPYVPELYKPRTAEQYLAEKTTRITEPATDPATDDVLDEDPEEHDTKDTE